MQLFIAEKPSQAEGIAKVLGGARKTSVFWDTDNGMVTWCYGHMLELAEPGDYDEKWATWAFEALPCAPVTLKYQPPPKRKNDTADTAGFKARRREQLTAIGSLLKKATEVVIATDPDRQGEAIARNVLDFHKYSGPIKRLWLSSTDTGSVRKALANLKPGAETLPLCTVARALAEADWLVGMNGTRGVSAKLGGQGHTGHTSIGRVQTPTLALIVLRDRAIDAFKAQNYYELVSPIKTATGATVTLRHAPRETPTRIYDRALAEQRAREVAGQKDVTLHFEEKPMSKAPPKLFTLSELQKRANNLWDWEGDHTLDVAQALYEKHKATSYPRTNCEYLPTDQRGEALAVAAHLIRLPDFKHLAGATLVPRDAIYDSSKVEAHHAIIPTGEAANLSAMSTDERKLYLLVAARFLSSLMPDYEYLSSKISTTVLVGGGVSLEFSTSGTVMVKPGWRSVDSGGEEGGAAAEACLPHVKNGEAGVVEGCQIEAKKTEAPARYTTATLLDDMENIARYVVDEDKKALLKSKEGKVGSGDRGIGTSATRGDIIAKLKRQKTIEMKGKKISATAHGHELITYLEKELPQLVDLGSTAVWEAKLGQIAEGTLSPEAFGREMRTFVADIIAVLGKRADAARKGGGMSAGAPTGVKYKDVEVQRHADAENKGKHYYTVAGVVKGRIYDEKWGHRITPDELLRLLGGETVEVSDGVSREGKPVGPKKFRYDAEKKPWPDVVVVDETIRESTGVETEKKRGKGGMITKCTTPTGKVYYTVEGVVAGGFPVKFWSQAFGRIFTEEDVGRLLAAGATGVEFDTTKADGSSGKIHCWYNPKKKPYAGVDVV